MRASRPTALRGPDPPRARARRWALVAACAVCALGGPAPTASHTAVTPAVVPAPESLYEGLQTPDLPREWRFHRPPIGLEPAPPRRR